MKIISQQPAFQEILRHRDKIRYAMLEKLKKEKLMQRNNFLSIELSSSGELINCISAAAIITGC